MKIFVFVMVVLMSCQFSVAEENDLRVTDVWMRPVILENRPTALYFTINNNTARDDRLIKAVSLLANHIEFHVTKYENGVMRMTKLDDIPVAAHSMVKVEPGGYHLMVYGLSMKFPLGAEFPLMLTFANGKRIPVVAKVGKKAP